MAQFDTLAEQAESEIHEAKRQCKTAGYDGPSRAKLWELIRAWIAHPQFGGCNTFESVVLNELAFTLADEPLRREAWSLVTELAGSWHREGNATMKELLRITIFEIAAEPPENARTLELLFSLASDPNTRWAVFAAYEHHPWRLRPHASKYSDGVVTDDDCDHWLTTQGLYQDEILMSSPRSDPEALNLYLENKKSRR